VAGVRNIFEEVFFLNCEGVRVLVLVGSWKIEQCLAAYCSWKLFLFRS